MSFNFIKEFWFKAVVFTLALLVLTTWALAPVSHQDLITNQELSLEQLTASTEKLISKNFKVVQNEIEFLLSELKSTNTSNNLENIDSSVKGLFALEQKESQLELSGDELRSLDLSYWSKEDLTKSINRVYKSDDGLYYTGYQIISSPSGENYFGYLFLNESKYYFAILNLHFASTWAKDLSISQNNVFVINSVGELIFHPETQYIGTEFNQVERIIENFDDTKQSLHYKSRDELSFVVSSSTKDIKVIVSQSRWANPYGASFYGKFLLVFLCLGLLLYTLSEYLVKKSRTKFLSKDLNADDIAMGESYDSKKYIAEKKTLVTKIKSLENKLASQKEFVSPSEQKRLLHEIKSKSANLIGQIELVKGQSMGDAADLVETAYNKAVEIYKQIFNFLDLKEEVIATQVEAVESSLSKSERTLDYEIESEISFYEDSERIEITEEDIGSEDLKLFGEVAEESLSQRIKETKSKMDISSIEEDISRQLSEQNYKKIKKFDIEEEFLSIQKNEVMNLSANNSLKKQMSDIDKVIENADRKVNESTNEIKKIIRKPRLSV